MPNSDKIKKTVEDLELERRAAEAKDAALKALEAGLEKAGEYVHAKRDVIEAKLDQAHAKIDEKTDGKYADKTSKARAFASRQVDKLEEKRPVGGAAGAAGTHDWSSPADGAAGLNAMTDTPEALRTGEAAPAATDRVPAPGEEAWSTAGVPVDTTPTGEFPIAGEQATTSTEDDPWAVHPDEPGAQPPTT